MPTVNADVPTWGCVTQQTQLAFLWNRPQSIFRQLIFLYLRRGQNWRGLTDKAMLGPDFGKGLGTVLLALAVGAFMVGSELGSE